MINQINFKMLDKFKSLNLYIEKIKVDREIIKWEFFHPFYYIMLNKYKLFKMGDGFLERNNNTNFKFKKPNIISTFHFKCNKYSKVEFMSIIYCYIDELMGNFIYALDPNFILTTAIDFSKINDLEIENILENLSKMNYAKTNDYVDFVCIVELNEILDSWKKLNFSFNLYHIQDNLKYIKFNLVIEGNGKFQKPKVMLPMSMSKF